MEEQETGLRTEAGGDGPENVDHGRKLDSIVAVERRTMSLDGVRALLRSGLPKPIPWEPEPWPGEACRRPAQL